MRSHEYALTAGPAKQRPYVSDSLTLFLTLTNVRGTPYSLSGDSEGSAEEDTAYYGDKLQFETVKDANTRPALHWRSPCQWVRQ